MFTIFASMIGALVDLDTAVLLWIHAHHNSVLDWLMPVLRDKWTWVPCYVFMLAFMLINFGKRGGIWILFFIFSIVLSDLASSRLIKYQVKRLRPCHTEQVAERLDLLVSCGGQYSFTSSHACNHFAMAGFIFFTLGGLFRRIRWPVLIWAGLIAFAQVYVGVHYPLDVLAGGLLGMLIGGLVAWYYGRSMHSWSVSGDNR